MSEKFYKVLNENGESTNGGQAQWCLPHDGLPGNWMPRIKGKLVPCKNGYHLCREKDLIYWLGPGIYEAEYRGERKNDKDKTVVRLARLLRRMDNWNERSARLFACDCAAWALTLLQEPDPRSIEAVRVARLFAVGKANGKQLAAAWDAAWAAAWDAAGAAAGAAARDAARAAAGAAARDAARAGAWYAAGAAAWDAAGAAAWAAAWYAAGAAAAAAAWDAANLWMTERLFQYLRGQVA